MRKRLRIRRSAGLAERPRLPALRRRGAHFQDAGQEHPDRPLQVLPVPQAVPREGRDRLRGQPRPAAHVVAGDCLLSSSKKGISAATSFTALLGVTLKTAWFMSHRIREAMRDGVLAPMGGGGSSRPTKPTFGKARSSAAVTSSATAVPSPRGQGRPGATSAPSSRWSSAAARSAPSTSRTPTRRPSANIVAENIARKPPAYRRKPHLRRRDRHGRRATKP